MYTIKSACRYAFNSVNSKHFARSTERPVLEKIWKAKIDALSPVKPVSEKAAK